MRERKSDILLLVNHFLEHTAGNYGEVNPPKMTSAAMVALMDYDWPGNVRELQNAIQFAYVKCRGANIITVDDLPLELREMAPKVINVPGLAETPPSLEAKLTREAIDKAIEKAKGNKSKAAKILGISRATLYRHL